MDSNENYYSQIIKNKNITLKSIIILILFLSLNFSLKNIYTQLWRNNNNYLTNNSLIAFKNHFLFENLNHSVIIKIINLHYSFSFKFKKLKIEYIFGFYDKNNDIILPSDLVIYSNLNIFCNIKLKSNNSIDSLPNIYKNKFYNCIEFWEINENLQFGIKIYYNNQYSIIYYSTNQNFTYNNLIYQFDYIFDPFLINNEYNLLIKNRNELKLNKHLRLKASYMEYPNCIFKRNLALSKDKWIFTNIYSYYFCFCEGQICFEKNVTESCKYFFYLYIIDNNKNVYTKTDYLFIDFIYAELSSDDVYPIFQEMIKKNFSVHYITEKYDIYQRYCHKIEHCLIILPVIKERNPINSSFLEKYLTLLLRLKVVVTGRGTTFNTNIFYNIEYFKFTQ